MGETPIERARIARFDALEGPGAVTWSDGTSLTILPGDQLCRAVYVSGTYEPQTLRVLRSVLRPGDVFLDVGANAGVIALAASRWVSPGGRVYAFEPSEREFARLEDTIGRNGTTNIHAIRAAAGGRAGHGTLRVAAAGYGGLNTLGTSFPYEGVETARLESVQIVTLDAFVADHDVTRVRAIKLDVEGAEGEALSGARRMLERDRPVLVLELLARALEASGWTIEALEGLLADARYTCFRIDDETARLQPLPSLHLVDEQNVVALPVERGFAPGGSGLRAQGSGLGAVLGISPDPERLSAPDACA